MTKPGLRGLILIISFLHLFPDVNNIVDIKVKTQIMKNRTTKGLPYVLPSLPFLKIFIVSLTLSDFYCLKSEEKGI